MSNTPIPLVDRWGWLALSAAAPFFLFPSAWDTPVMLVAPGLLWLQARSAARRTALDWPILLLAIMALVSLYATYDVAVSLPKIAGVLLGIAAFYTSARLSASRAGWWPALAAFLAGGIAVAGLGLLGARWPTKIDFLQSLAGLLPDRLISLPGAEGGFQPNEVAGALLWVIPPLWALAWFVVARAGALRARLGSARYAACLGATFTANALVLAAFALTQSRSAYLGLALTIPAMLVFGLRGRARWIAAAVFLIPIVGGLVYFSAAPVELFDGGDVQIDTLNGRLEIWSRALYGLQDFPFTGMGMNTFRRIVHILYPLFLISPDFDIAHAHNEFLQAGLDLGLPGLIALAALYLGAFALLIQTIRRDRNPTSPDFGQTTGRARNPKSPDFGQTIRRDRNPKSPDFGRSRETSDSVASKPGVRDIHIDLKRIGNDPFDPACLTLGLGGGLLAHFIYGLTDAIALGAKPGLLFWILLGLIVGLERFSWNSNSMH